MAKKSFSNIQRTAVEFNPDYSQTKRDLKRIGVLAVTFFALLIALTFFLN
jgi:hypothetical protein